MALAFGCLGAAAVVLDARAPDVQAAVAGGPAPRPRSSISAGSMPRSVRAIAADVVWVRAIEYDGAERHRAPSPHRFERLAPLLDRATTLDPRFSAAYQIGAIFLSADPPNGPGRTDEAIALLKRGLAADPSRWQYAYDVGFVYYWHGGRYADAARWFDRAARMSGAPEWLEPLSAVTLAEGGNRAGARRLLGPLATAGEPYIRNAAGRYLQQLDALDDIDRAQSLVARFRAATGSRPLVWDDLVRVGAMAGIPLDPTGAPLALDTSTGIVGIDPHSSLAPLPRALGNR